jgi:hypothetical protein
VEVSHVRHARWVTAFLVVAAVLAPCVAVWGALHLAWPIVWGGVAVFVVAGWFGGGRLIGKVDDEP